MQKYDPTADAVKDLGVSLSSPGSSSQSPQASRHGNADPYYYADDVQGIPADSPRRDGIEANRDAFTHQGETVSDWKPNA
jgi:hypothetical protein